MNTHSNGLQLNAFNYLSAKCNSILALVRFADINRKNALEFTIFNIPIIETHQNIICSIWWFPNWIRAPLVHVSLYKLGRTLNPTRCRLPTPDPAQKPATSIANWYNVTFQLNKLKSKFLCSPHAMRGLGLAGWWLGVVSLGAVPRSLQNTCATGTIFFFFNRTSSPSHTYIKWCTRIQFSARYRYVAIEIK